MMKSTSAPTAAKTVIRWLRWAAVLGLVYSAWFGLLYYVLQVVGLYSCPLFLFVAAGANRATVSPHDGDRSGRDAGWQSFWGHALANQPPQVTNYQLIIAASSR